MKKILLSILCLTLANITTAQSPIFQWAKGISNASGRSITSDASGNTFVTGQFTGTTDFDPSASTFTMASNGNDDVYIAKYDASGNFVWAKSYGGPGYDYGMSIDLDASGNIYIAGIFQNTVDFDPSAGSYTLASNGGEDIYICKLNSSGSFVWAKSIGGSTTDNAWDCFVDASGSIFTTGSFEGIVDFDPSASVSNLSSVSGYGTFISKLDALGNFVWAKSFTGGFGGLNRGNGIKCDISGNVYTTGFFLGTVDFDPSGFTYTITTSSPGTSDAFISKLDASGNFVWAKAIGGLNDDVGNAICIDALGNVYSTGEFASTVDFDPSASSYTLASGGGTNVYISKLDAFGNFVWAKALLGSTYATTNDVDVDASNNIYTIGWYSNTTDFDPGVGTNNITPVAGNDIFILKLDAFGNFGWANSFGGSNSDAGFSIDIDASNNIYTTGLFNFTVDFDPSAGVLNLTGTPEGSFVHKMWSCVPPNPPTNITPATNLTVCIGNTTNLSVASTATVNWYSSLTSTTSMATGTNYITPVLGAGIYTYFAEASTCTTSAQRTAISFSVIGCITGLKNVVAESDFVEIYPNPSTDILNIKLNSFTSPVSIQVINTLGEIIKQVNVTDTISILNTQDLINGIYFLKMKNENNQQLIKFIKQ